VNAGKAASAGGQPGLLARVPARVRIVEVGPRDGLQNEALPVPAAAKIEFIAALAAAGLAHVEVTSFVSPRKVPQLADAEEVCRGMTRQEGVTYTALVPNETGLQRALAAGVRSIALFTAASETFNRKNIGASIAESLATIGGLAAAGAREGLRLRAYVSMAFVCPYEGRIEPAAVLAIVDRLRDLGIRNISLGDTLGAAYPDQVNRLL
jgi:isopropylmalate/homocitrate/citramalate synthase